MVAARLGAWSGAAVGWVGIAYVIVLALGLASYGLSEPIVDPILAVMELLTLASAVPLVMLVAAVHQVARGERRIWGVLALCLVAMFAATTSVVHVTELTAGRQLGTHGLVWPSVPYAAELVAWDLFLGAALLCTAAALDPGRTSSFLRRATRGTGLLCLAGLAGPAVGNMRIQLIGVFGYAVGLPIVAFALSRWFRSSR